MTDNIKLPPMPEWAKMDNLNGMVPSEIRSALNEFGREAVRLNAQGGSVAPQLAVSPYLLSDIRELAAYAEGSKSPRMVHASRAAFAWLEGAQLAEPDEPNWRHPKIQGLIGSEARLRITIDLIWQILEDPNQEFTASDMEYWDAIHDKLKEALSTKPAPQPAQAAPDGLKEKLTDLLADGLRGTWHCNRVWEAWHVGTMSEDDFEPVEESDTPAELADAVIAMLSAAPAAPQPAQQPLTDEQANCWCESCDLAKGRPFGRTRMSICPNCGDKRCPRAKHHDNACAQHQEQPQKKRVVIGYVPISAIEETPLDGYVPVYAPERKD